MLYIDIRFILEKVQRNCVISNVCFLIVCSIETRISEFHQKTIRSVQKCTLYGGVCFMMCPSQRESIILRLSHRSVGLFIRYKLLCLKKYSSDCYEFSQKLFLRWGASNLMRCCLVHAQLCNYPITPHKGVPHLRAHVPLSG